MTKKPLWDSIMFGFSYMKQKPFQKWIQQKFICVTAIWFADAKTIMFPNSKNLLATQQLIYHQFGVGLMM